MHVDTRTTLAHSLCDLVIKIGATDLIFELLKGSIHLENVQKRLKAFC